KWRENRDVLVGSYARRGVVDANGNGEYGNQLKTGEYNLVLTGAAFLHRKYLDLYTNNMPAEIRQIVDDLTNCEDLAVNFLIANATQKAHLHTVTATQWKIKNRNLLGGGNDECLSCRPQHYAERRQCVANFTEIYGHNPLVTSKLHALPACL
ncbi:RIB-2 protein, partial [Aphelenchoides avenae]